MEQPIMPPVTDSHRRAAFCAMRWSGWTFDAAMADATRAKVIECRAHHIRTQEWKAQAQRTVMPVKRCRPEADGQAMRWSTQLAVGPWADTDQPKLESQP